MNITKEIATALRKFAIQHGISITDAENFSNVIGEQRKPKFIDDTFSHMANYLTIPELIKFSTVSKDMYAFYPLVWGIIQSWVYPYSLIPSSDYIAIRTAICIDYYYYYANMQNNPYFTAIKEEERCIRKLEEQLDYLRPTHMYYKLRKVTHANELKYRREDLKEYIYQFNMSRSIFDQDVLFDYLMVSVKNPSGIPYLTVKQLIDARLYGWDPVENPVEYENIQKWMSGDFNGNYIGVRASDPYDPAFEYEYDDNGIQVRKYRLKPDYCA